MLQFHHRMQGQRRFSEQKYGQKGNYVLPLSLYFIVEMKESLILLLFSLLVLTVSAQESNSAYRTLQLPTSTHAVALGGDNISLDDDDPALVLHNPALLTNITPGSIGLSFLSLGQLGSWASAQYVRAFGERHTAAAFAAYRGYGTLTARDNAGNEMGTFSPKDIVAGLGYGYILSDHWAGGANLKVITAQLSHYSAAAVAVDVGTNYYDEDEGLSLSFVLRNVGAQFSSFDGRTETVPYNLQVGLSKQLAHVPLRFHLTLTDLTRWQRSDYVQANEKALSTARLLTNHLILGVDWMPSRFVSLSAGYNFRRAYELSTLSGAHGAGWSLGANFHFSRLSLQLAWSKHHAAQAALMGSLAFSL